jgi:hypothetical protein
MGKGGRLGALIKIDEKCLQLVRRCECFSWVLTLFHPQDLGLALQIQRDEQLRSQCASHLLFTKEIDVFKCSHDRCEAVAHVFSLPYFWY